jgi:hypothetical protein
VYVVTNADAQTERCERLGIRLVVTSIFATSVIKRSYKMFNTKKTDYAGLKYWLNRLSKNGFEIVQILPSVEYNATLYVIVYKELQNG